MLQNKMNKTIIGTIIAIAAAFIFAFYPSATRAVYADGGNAIFIILFTCFWRALSLFGFCALKGKPLFENKTDLKYGLTNGFFQTISMIGILGGMAYLPGPIVIIIIFSHTLMLYFLLVFKKQETLNVLSVISVIFALLGLSLVINLNHNFEGLHTIGIAMAFIAALATTSRLYIYGNLTKSREPAVIGAEAFLLTFIFCGLLLFYDNPVPPQTTHGWLWASLSALSLSIGGFGMFYGISLLGSFRFSFLSKLEPIFATIIAAILINEILTIQQYIGIGIVIASLAFYQIRKQPKN